MVDSKIKILELVDSFGYAGTQRTVINFCRNLDRRFFSVYAAAFEQGGPRETELQEMGVPYVVANKTVAVIVDFAVKEQIQVVHIHRSGQFVPFQFELLKAIKNAVPAVVIIETNVFGRFDKAAFPLIDRSLQISQMMFNERYVKEAGFVDFARMGVLHYPVDPSSFERHPFTATEIAEFKQQIGIQPGDFVIGKMGRPHIAKWSDLLLEMMPYLIRAVPNIKLIIQALPESRRAKVAKSAYKDHVILLNETSDDRKVAMFYAALDVYVHASKIGESFGMTLAEAGLFGKPVVVNSTPHRDNAQVELIDHLETGIIANHPQTFARAIAYLARNPDIKRRLGEQARAKVTTIFNPSRITRTMEKIVVDVLRAKGVVLPNEMTTHYEPVVVWPAPAEIVAFKTEYEQRVKQEFGSVNVWERIVNWARAPKRIFQKIVDFIYDKQHPNR